MFARSYKVTAVSTPLTRGRCGAERLSPDSLPPLPHRLGGWRWPTLLDHSRPQRPSAIVSWSRGLETRVSGSSPDVRKFRTSGHACAEVTNITAHAHNGVLSTAPLGRKKVYFLRSLQRVASLGCFENADFTQLGFIDNLQSKKEIHKNQLNTLLGCRTETINRQIIVWV